MTPPVLKTFADIATRLTVSPPPHWRSGRTIQGHMTNLIIALLPAALLAIIHGGMDAARVMALSCAVAVAAEAGCMALMRRPLGIDNLTALFHGLVLAMLLPAQAPWWLVVAGALITVVFGRAIFGGYAASPVCAPALAWCMLKVSWPARMDYDIATASFSMVNDALYQLKHFGLEYIADVNYFDLFIGSQSGALGASMVVAVLGGGVWLLVKREIRPYLPLSYLAGVFVTSFIIWLTGDAYADPFFHLLAGSTIFGAFFLCTDHPSTPVGKYAQVLFGLVAGIMTMLIRSYGALTDGVVFAILLTNLLTPLMDRVKPKPFGGKANA